MTQEEKAKAYDEALAKCKAYMEDTKKRWSEEFCKATEKVFEEIFSQLKESENERIRKTLIDALKTSKSVGELKFILPEPTREECLAYLEKQGEQKVSVDDFKAKDWYVSKVDGKIHNIYYSVDKVKPKFKVGDKIIEKNFDECGRGTIIDIKDGKYIFDDGGFICIEEQGLWKLVEQKPAEGISQQTVQGKGVYKICPRCKERMVRDDSMVYTSMPPQYRYECPKCGESECDTVMYDNPEMGKQKPEWSEGDELMMKAIIGILDENDHPKLCSWLKSLPLNCADSGTRKFHEGKDFAYQYVGFLIDSLQQEMWKPSEEQMKALNEIVNILAASPFLHQNDYLFNILKGLREELKNCFNHEIH